MRGAYTASDYLGALKALLPRGSVWRARTGGVQEQVLVFIAAGLARLDAAALSLLTDAFPASAIGLLPKWEASTGLPDPCAGEAPTLQQRQAQVVARLANDGGQSKAFFIQFAARLGYTITITEFSPARVGHLRCGQHLGGSNWAHAWRVTAPLHTVTRFRVGASSVGEPLSSFGNDVLECEIRARAPAHTLINFAYV